MANYSITPCSGSTPTIIDFGATTPIISKAYYIYFSGATSPGCFTINGTSVGVAVDGITGISNANDDFPEPETPVTTINLLRGIVTVMFLRLCTLAPCITILLSIFRLILVSVLISFFFIQYRKNRPRLWLLLIYLR